MQATAGTTGSSAFLLVCSIRVETGSVGGNRTVGVRLLLIEESKNVLHKGDTAQQAQKYQSGSNLVKFFVVMRRKEYS